MSLSGLFFSTHTHGGRNCVDMMQVQVSDAQAHTLSRTGQSYPEYVQQLTG